MKPDEDLKTNSIRARVTEDEARLFKIVAESHGISVSDFLRRAAVYYSEVSTGPQEGPGCSEENPNTGQETFPQMLADTRLAVVNTIKYINDDLVAKMENIEDLLDALLYAVLYHLPEIPDEKKEHAMRSATKRKAKVQRMTESKKNSSINAARR